MYKPLKRKVFGLIIILAFFVTGIAFGHPKFSLFFKQTVNVAMEKFAGEKDAFFELTEDDVILVDADRYKGNDEQDQQDLTKEKELDDIFLNEKINQIDQIAIEIMSGLVKDFQEVLKLAEKNVYLANDGLLAIDIEQLAKIEVQSEFMGKLNVELEEANETARKEMLLVNEKAKETLIIVKDNNRYANQMEIEVIIEAEIHKIRLELQVIKTALEEKQKWIIKNHASSWRNKEK